MTNAKLPTLNFADEVPALVDVSVRAPSGRGAKSWLVADSLRLTMHALMKGINLPLQKNPAPLSIQVLQGEIRLTVEGLVVRMPQGMVALLEPGTGHSLEAISDSVFLVTTGSAATARAA